VSEKNKFKASSYLGEIQGKEKELQAARLKVVDQEEEMRKLALTKQKFQAEREHLLAEMSKQEVELREMRSTYDGQLRLIQNLTGHAKNQSALLND
jgi:predicted  nucleic acid-binding Zn-ribbon protein